MIVLEGIVVTVLVVVGLREAIMNAVPLALKRSIGVGIGLFILFIGFVNGGFIVVPEGGVPPVTVVFPTTTANFVFLLGLVITVALYVMKIRAALIISIFVTTIIAIVTGVQTIPSNLTATPSFATIGQFDVTNVFSQLGLLTALLTIFAIMLTDFFDTMGTVTGVAAEAGLSRRMVPCRASVASCSSTASRPSPAGPVASARTRPTSRAPRVSPRVAGRGSPRSSPASCSCSRSSCRRSPGSIPSVATAPALVLVGYLMFTLVKDIPVADLEDGIPALLTMILMPLTYDITVGIGAGFISWVLIKVVRGKFGEIHPLMWVVSIAFVVYFAKDWIEAVIG